jgi:hypothetical protein
MDKSRAGLGSRVTQATARRARGQSASSHPESPTVGAPASTASDPAASARPEPRGRAHPGDRLSHGAASVAGPASFQARVNSECAVATAGLPGVARASNSQPGSQAGGPPGEGSAGSAEHVIIQRKIKALSRLRPPTSLRAPTGLLVSSLRRLQQFYPADDRASAGPPQGALAATERQAASAAMAAGVPACSPTGTVQPERAGAQTGTAQAGPPGRLRPPMPPGPAGRPSPAAPPSAPGE